MSLKTLRTLPPGGWAFDQKAPDGSIRKFSEMGPFGDAVLKIQNYRKGNGIKPDDVDSIAHELEVFTCARLGNDPNWCESKKNSLLSRISVLPAHVLKAAHRVADVGRGVQIISDWLGDGGVPVSQELANGRGAVCLKCPLNQDGHNVAKLTDKIAEAILDQRRKKLEMNLRVEGEADLHTCEVCLCHLPLKVWVPIKTIAERTHPKLMEKFPEYCWMKTETSTPKETTT